ncbi:MAG: CPBP family intramembrane metalloprotease [Saprospiraceae bacterium]|nr:CPBP family intramembrane metalloprotease [Saprospiraceae bacterium]
MEPEILDPRPASSLAKFPSFLMVLIMSLLLGYMLSGLLIIGLGNTLEFELQRLLQSLNKDSSLYDRNLIRGINLISHFFSFTFPSLLCMYIVYQKKWLKELQLTIVPSSKNISLGILLILVSFPFAMYIYSLNQMIPLPEWASSMEASTKEMIEGLLVMNGPLELLFSLFVMAILPAIGEELLFRGILQSKLSEWIKKEHIAIWITAFIFSLFHLQFEGFFPRMLLGALLGYLFSWTRNLWVPIVAHFFFNGFQVAGQYFGTNQISDTDLEQIEEVHWGFGLVSLILLLIVSNFVKRSNQQ